MIGYTPYASYGEFIGRPETFIRYSGLYRGSRHAEFIGYTQYALATATFLVVPDTLLGDG
jgi:hypothetical protein